MPRSAPSRGTGGEGKKTCGGFKTLRVPARRARPEWPPVIRPGASGALSVALSARGVTVPRRNQPVRSSRRHPCVAASVPDVDQPTTDELAADLVARGLASELILEPGATARHSRSFRPGGAR